MRIGMMVDVYKPHISGITNYISLNKRYLEEAGNEVFIFTFGDQDNKDDETNIIRSPGLPLTDTGYYINFRYPRKVKALLQTMDVVHVHHPFLSGRLALLYCRPLRIPIIFTNHTRYDLYAQTYLPLLPEELSDTFLETYLPLFCSGVDLVISPSAGMAGVLYALGVKTNVEVVPNGVELERFNNPHRSQRSKFGYSSTDILAVYSGRLAPEKNLDFLLSTFIGVAEAVPDTHLLFVGGGPEEERLRQVANQSSIPERIHFSGMVPYEELPDYLSMSDLFVTASVTEVHPLSVIEAMASGLPCLGIQSVGVGDTIEDGRTGYLSRNDPASFAAKLTRLCMDGRLREKMGTSARISSRKYAIERTTKIMLSHYERLLFEAGKQKRGMGYRLRSLLERYRA
jgi:1,2-diacylglycerol 3-alpha-glucosyltransferase